MNGAGARFTNETKPYGQSGHDIVRLHATSDVAHIPSCWIVDQRQVDRDAFGGDQKEPIDPAWFGSSLVFSHLAERDILAAD